MNSRTRRAIIIASILAMPLMKVACRGRGNSGAPHSREITSEHMENVLAKLGAQVERERVGDESLIQNGEVVPCFGRLVIIDNIFSIIAGAIPATGSSRSNKSAPEARQHAKFKSFCWPYERSDAKLSAFSVSSVFSRME